MTRRGRLGVNVSVLAGSQVVTWAMTLVWTLVVPRALGPAGMGALVTAWSATAILGVLLGLGTRNFLVRKLVTDPDEARSLLGTAIVLRLALIPLFVAVVVVYTRVAGFAGEEAVVLDLATAATALTLLAEPMQAVFQAVERMEFLAYADIVSKVIQGLVAVGLALAGLGPIGLTACWLAVSVLVLLLHVVWIRPYVTIDLRTTLRRLRALVRESLAYWVFGFFYMTYLWIDSVMLALMAPPAVVGWYGVATKLFTTLMFIPVILSTAWLPRLVRAHEESPQRLREVARLPLELVLILSLPLTAGTALLAGSIMRALYGAAYADAAPVLVILALCLPAMYVNIVLNQILVAAGRQASWTKVMAGATIVNPLLNLELIAVTQDRMGNGAIGAALSLLGTEILILLAGLAIVGHEVLDSRSLGRLVRASLAAGAMAALVYAARPLGPVVEVLAGAIAFPTLCAVLRVPTAEEARFLRSGIARARSWASRRLTSEAETAAPLPHKEGVG